MRKNATVIVLAIALLGLAGSAYAVSTGDTAVTSVNVNGNNIVAVGTTNPVTFTVTVVATDDSGIKDADFYLYGSASAFLGPSGAIGCVASSATESTCTGTFTVNPRIDLWDNDQAGQWQVATQVEANDGDFFTNEQAGLFNLQRFSRLTANAFPEPVSQGGTITVTGSLTRANWETHNYTGYAESVRLQSRSKSGTVYGDVKTAASSASGQLRATVTATTDKCWRWDFDETSTTMAVTSGGDCVDVR
ncbi:MAG: hypothetical protein ACRDT8_11970 [Micromonosporaceae bacterium]